MISRSKASTKTKRLKAAHAAHKVTSLLSARPHHEYNGKIWIFSDGSYDPKNHRGGWGATILHYDRIYNIYGPVQIDSRSLHYIGATTASNNTGELSAIFMSLFWLKHHNTAHCDTEIYYDSTYAAKS